MEGIYFNELDSGPVKAGLNTSSLKLLASGEHMEIMYQTLTATAKVWLIPAEDLSLMEFFLVYTGEIELMLDTGPKCLKAGEYFFLSQLKEQVMLKAKRETRLVYVANQPMFESTIQFQEDLMQLVEQINSKDHYTFQHSRNVMDYSVKLYENLPGSRSSVSINEIVIASLFHDVGKCYIPDEILKKNGQLTPAEYRYILRHPIDSGRLLKPNFGSAVAEIASNHHERLDGSGYPCGLHADEISLESKIVAVADVFDAMTTNRGYNLVKDFNAAADELCSLPDQFDAQVTGVLRTLVSAGQIVLSPNVSVPDVASASK